MLTARPGRALARLGAVVLAAAAVPALAQSNVLVRGPLPAIASGRDLPVPPPPDGRVTDLDPATYAELDRFRKSNLSTVSASFADGILAVLRKDGVIDPTELDLVGELTHFDFSMVTVIPRGSSGTGREPRFMLRVTSLDARRILRAVYDPPLDFEAEYARGAAGWRELVADAGRSSEREAEVTAFLVGKAGEAWRAGSPEDAWKPFRDFIARLYGWSAALPQPDGPGAGKLLLFRVCRDADTAARGDIPDSLCSWLVPPGTV